MLGKENLCHVLPIHTNTRNITTCGYQPLLGFFPSELNDLIKPFVSLNIKTNSAVKYFIVMIKSP